MHELVDISRYIAVHFHSIELGRKPPYSNGNCRFRQFYGHKINYPA
ncbi:MAG: hypothetical protein ACYDG6_03160 [Thermincolia bacterium]